MATLKDSIVTGDLRVTGTLYANLKGAIMGLSTTTDTVGSASGWSAGTAPSLTSSSYTVNTVSSWSAGTLPSLVSSSYTVVTVSS